MSVSSARSLESEPPTQGSIRRVLPQYAVVQAGSCYPRGQRGAAAEVELRSYWWRRRASARVFNVKLAPGRGC